MQKISPSLSATVVESRPFSHELQRKQARCHDLPAPTTFSAKYTRLLHREHMSPPPSLGLLGTSAGLDREGGREKDE